MILAALAMGLEMVETQLSSVLDAVSAVCAGEAVSEINGEPFFLAYPIHPLVALGSVDWF